MQAQNWVDQLRVLGYDAQLLNASLVTFPFTVPCGRFLGMAIAIAIAVPDDTMQPPTGPHVSPRLLDLHPDQTVAHPVGGVHPADHLGPDWQYWSRPFPGWLQTTRDAAAYLRHINHLFATA